MDKIETIHIDDETAVSARSIKRLLDAAGKAAQQALTVNATTATMPPGVQAQDRQVRARLTAFESSAFYTRLSAMQPTTAHHDQENHSTQQRR